VRGLRIEHTFTGKSSQFPRAGRFILEGLSIKPVTGPRSNPKKYMRKHVWKTRIFKQIITKKSITNIEPPNISAK